MTSAILRAADWYQDLHHHQRDFFDSTPGRDALHEKEQSFTYVSAR